MSLTIGQPGLRRHVTLTDGSVSTTTLDLGQGEASMTGRELVLEFDSSRWRHDVPTWRWHDGEDPDLVETAVTEAFDDSGWRVVPHLHPVLTVTHDRPSWFRAQVPIPDWARGETVFIVLGGYDHEDWMTYQAFLGGVSLGAWTGSGTIRQPHVVAIEPGHAAYDGIRFGTDTLLVVRTEGLDRREPAMRAGEEAHYFSVGWLLDQYVAVGTPTMTVDDFAPSATTETLDGWQIEVASLARPEIKATLQYTHESDLMRKRVVVHNDGPDTVRLLDAVLEEWTGDFRPTGGGRGQPLLLPSAFVGIEHPAGVQFGAPGIVRLVQMPGCDIAPGGRWTSQSVVIGSLGRAQDTAAAFRDYVRGLRSRPDDRWVAYSALGWYDFTNPADPIPELTEDLMLENLDRLRKLADRGVFPDIYMFDDWWGEDSLGSFRKSAFPNGPGRVLQGIQDLGMRPGLWWATTRALWSAGTADFLQPARANSPEFGSQVALAGGEWAWLEEFSNLFIGERRYCLAAEPYRSHAKQSIAEHVAVLRAGILKLDCAVLHCTSSQHDHRPGRHSVEPMVDAIVQLVDACREQQPDLRVIWYWGFRSPWFLAHGDQLFDKGLLLEAATPASTPAPTSRQAMSLNVDQSIQHAQLLPVDLQDSLGVWLGDVAWCNRIGSEEWREAFLLDTARASWLIQPWGDLDLLGEEDKRTLADVLAWARRIGHAGTNTVTVGGDPWLAQPYGYARPMDGGVLVSLFNPTWFEASIALPAAIVGHGEAVELYPRAGRRPAGVTADTKGVLVSLRPFELRMVAFVPSSRMSGDLPVSRREDIRPTRSIALDEPLHERPGEPSLRRVTLPRMGLGDVIFVAGRFRQRGAWWYHPEPQTLLDIRAHLNGLAVHGDVIPRTRHRNGPGSAWVLYRIPAGPSWTGRTLELEVRADAPDDVDVSLSVVVVDAWWQYRDRTFRDPFAAD